MLPKVTIHADYLYNTCTYTLKQYKNSKKRYIYHIKIYTTFKTTTKKFTSHSYIFSTAGLPILFYFHLRTIDQLWLSKNRFFFRFSIKLRIRGVKEKNEHEDLHPFHLIIIKVLYQRDLLKQDQVFYSNGNSTKQK